MRGTPQMGVFQQPGNGAMVNAINKIMFTKLLKRSLQKRRGWRKGMKDVRLTATVKKAG